MLLKLSTNDVAKCNWKSDNATADFGRCR